MARSGEYDGFGKVVTFFDFKKCLTSSVNVKNYLDVDEHA